MRDSALPLLPTLLENYDVLVYNGVDDALLPPSTGEALARACNWSGAAEFAKAPRSIWRVDDADKEIAGWGRQVGHTGADGDEKIFALVALRGAGHLVPFDQPRRALDMLERWINHAGWE